MKRKFKKLCAWMCTAIMVFGITGSASPILYQDYNDASNFAETGWKTSYSSIDCTNKTTEVSIVNGELIFPFSGWKKFTMSKDIDNAESTTKLIFEMTTAELGNQLYNGDANFDSYPYFITLEELDDNKNVVRSDTIAMNAYYYGFAVNGQKLASDYSYANWQLFTLGKPEDLRIIFDVENGKIYPQVKATNGDYQNLYNEAWLEAEANTMNAYKYDRIKIRVLEGTQTAMFDNIKLYDENAPETPYLCDDFDAEGLTFSGTGWKLSGATMIKSVVGGKVFFEYLGDTADYMALSHDIPAVAEGKQVIDIDYDLLNGNGERNGVNGDSRSLIFENSATGQKILTLCPRAKVGDSRYGLGTSPNTSLNTSDWTELNKIGDATSFRIVTDYDAKTIEVYYKSASGVYIKTLSVDASSVLGSGVCIDKVASLVYNIGAHGETTPDVIRIGNFKSYYIDDQHEASRPVFIDKATGTAAASPVNGQEGYIVTATTNNAVSGKPVSLIAAIYEDNDKLVDFCNRDFVSNITLEADAPAYDLFAIPFTVPSDLADGSSIKLFVWNSFDDMIPYSYPTELR